MAVKKVHCVRFHNKGRSLPSTASLLPRHTLRIAERANPGDGPCSSAILVISAKSNEIVSSFFFFFTASLTTH